MESPLLAAYITHPDCLKHEMGADHPECSERLGAIRDQLLITGLLDHMQCHEAPLASQQQLEQAHSALYVHDVAAHRPESGYVQVDPDTRMNPFTFQAARRASGAAVLATDLVLQGDARVAFCNIRPPGHHAGRASAGGFCFFNNVVVGIRHALNVHGLKRVALIDFDVHHGNGSENILHEDQRVLMCSTFEEGIFPFSGSVPMGANMVNVGLPSRSGGDAFRTSVSETWIPALEKFKPQMIFISAGFDGHREDDMGNLGLVEDDYAWVTKQIVQLADTYAQGRIVSCLEGGYELSALARSVAAHVKVLIGAD